MRIMMILSAAMALGQAGCSTHDHMLDREHSSGVSLEKCCTEPSCGCSTGKSCASCPQDGERPRARFTNPSAPPTFP